MRADAAEQQGIAIRRRVDHAGYTNNAARARDVLDHNGLAEKLGHPGRNDAADHVESAARGEGHHHCDGARGISLRVRRRGPNARRCSQHFDEIATLHVYLLKPQMNAGCRSQRIYRGTRSCQSWEGLTRKFGPRSLRNECSPYAKLVRRTNNATAL